MWQVENLGRSAGRMKQLDMAEVRQHNTPDDCWLVIHGNVYDLTQFHKSHPGGSKIITECAGKVNNAFL